MKCSGTLRNKERVRSRRFVSLISFLSFFSFSFSRASTSVDTRLLYNLRAGNGARLVRVAEAIDLLFVFVHDTGTQTQEESIISTWSGRAFLYLIT